MGQIARHKYAQNRMISVLTKRGYQHAAR